MGIAATRRPLLRQLSLGTAGVLQTIASLALLAFMIPLLGLDVRAAASIGFRSFRQRATSFSADRR